MSQQKIPSWRERLSRDERLEYEGVDQHTPAEIAMLVELADLRTALSAAEVRVRELEQASDLAIQLQNQAQSDAEKARDAALEEAATVASESTYRQRWVHAGANATALPECPVAAAIRGLKVESMESGAASEFHAVSKRDA